MNMVSIRVLEGVGLAKTIASLNRFGFEAEDLPRNLTLALGSHALTPLQIATAYAVFANGGFRVEPYLVDSVVDSKDREIYRARPLTVCGKCDERADDSAAPPRAPRVLDERVAYLIDSMLRDVIGKGTGKRALALGRRDLAGKTGTTNGPRDAWFSGYTGQWVATVWLGFDQNRLLGEREYGGGAALPIWMDYMREALSGMPEIVRELPDGLVAVRIDPRTGRRAAPGNDKAIYEYFRADRLAEIPGSNNAGAYADTSGEESLPAGLFN